MAEAAQGAAPRTSGSVPRASGSSPRARVRDAERTRGELLAVAIDEFTRHGLAGARVDEIAARTRTTKRMIYYYFGSKVGLYTAALEEVYAGIRAYERSLDLTGLEPAAALRELAEETGVVPVLVASGDASSDVVECFRERKFICRDDDEASLSLVRAPNGQYSGPWY